VCTAYSVFDFLWFRFRLATDCNINWVVDGNLIQPTAANCDERTTTSLPFSFDHVFSMDQSTAEVYKRVVASIVDQAFSGFNGTVLCYGQTSSGNVHLK